MVNSHDGSCQVVNIFETSYARETLQLLHRYYEAGYINQDACLRTSFSRFQGENVFLRLSAGGPDASTSYSTDFGYPIVAREMTLKMATRLDTSTPSWAATRRSRMKYSSTFITDRSMA